MDIFALLQKIDLTAVVASALTFIVGWAVVKVRLAAAMNVIGELSELLAEIHTASADGKYSPEEIKAIAKEGEDIIALFKK
jgi:hypothetical protein